MKFTYHVIWTLALVCISPMVNAAMVCPNMPASITTEGQDVKTDFKAVAGSIGKLKAAELEYKTEKIAKSLYNKFPNVDRLLTLEMMAATYCHMLKGSSLNEVQQLKKWETFQDKVLNLKDHSNTSVRSRSQPLKVSEENQNEKLSLNDRLLLDENRTELNVTDVTIEKWAGDAEPYITLGINNVSKRTAISVLPSLHTSSSASNLSFTPTKTATVFSTGVSINGEKSLRYPVAPISEFLEKFNDQCPNCRLIGLGLKGDIPVEMSTKDCEKMRPENGCILYKRTIPFLITISYKNIFGQDAEQNFPAWVYFSSTSDSLAEN